MNKIATALKGINQSMIPKGLEPYAISDPDRPIDAFLAMAGMYRRMTNSAPITIALNSVILGLERKIGDILEDKI